MTLEDLQTALRFRPFRPFRLYVTDGATFEVRHPELCMPGWRSVIVGLPSAGKTDPVFERYTVIDMNHITRIEPVESAATASN